VTARTENKILTLLKDKPGDDAIVQASQQAALRADANWRKGRVVFWVDPDLVTHQPRRAAAERLQSTGRRTALLHKSREYYSL
jgi:hypothetical protein